MEVLSQIAFFTMLAMMPFAYFGAIYVAPRVVMFVIELMPPKAQVALIMGAATVFITLPWVM